jgi:hypothetical protein
MRTDWRRRSSRRGSRSSFWTEQDLKDMNTRAKLACFVLSTYKKTTKQEQTTRKRRTRRRSVWCCITPAHPTCCSAGPSC